VQPPDTKDVGGTLRLPTCLPLCGYSSEYGVTRGDRSHYRATSAAQSVEVDRSPGLHVRIVVGTSYALARRPFTFSMHATTPTAVKTLSHSAADLRYARRTAGCARKGGNSACPITIVDIAVNRVVQIRHDHIHSSLLCLCGQSRQGEYKVPACALTSLVELHSVQRHHKKESQYRAAGTRSFSGRPG
jgi:hypothetical protein